MSPFTFLICLYLRLVAVVAGACICFSVSAGNIEDADKAYARKDYVQAISLYRKAAAEGDAIAQFKLGGMYARREGVAQNQREAVSWFTKAAAKGYAPAQNSLGVRFAKGQGVVQNSARAAALYREAAEQRFGLAQDNLSDLYANGLGVSRDIVLAHVWSGLASANGDGRALKKRLAIERAMNPTQITEASTHLGTMFARGHGVAQDVKRAARYFQEAAARGYVVAQFELAECYDKGNGLTKDYKQAAVWFQKAATQGHIRAQTSVAYMYEIGQGVTPDAKRAAHWYLKAAQQGDVIAQYNLGAMIESGRGVAQDHVEALKWLNIAEVNGSKPAIEFRRLVEGLMSPKQITEAQKRASEWMP